MDILLQVFDNLLSLEVILAILAGVIGGIVVGSLPGLSATMAIALLIPVTFGMSPVAGLIMLSAIYTAGVYGGSISGILIHTPGTPASAATSLDGYKLTQQGKGAKAIGVATISSMIGGFASGIALLFLAPPLSQISIAFSAPEYFLIALFGLTIISSLASNSVAKGLAGGVFGLFIGTIGMDVLTGYPRFTFGVTSLESGIQMIPAMIGLFSLSQVLILLEKKGKKAKSFVSKLEGKVLPTWKELKSLSATILRSSGIGAFVGLLPGAGGDIGAWVGYNEAKRFSKNKKEIGNGSLEGVSASETANNGVTGGALIPLLTLGIPGSTATAVLLGGIMIHGLTPGYQLFTTNAGLTYSIILGFIIANIVMGVIGLLGAKYFVKISKVSDYILAPIIVGFSVVGSYAINNNFFDVWIMLIFGLIGYLMRKTGFHPAPVILGVILGPIAEQGFRQSILMAQTDLLTYYFTRPISVVLIILIILSVFGPMIMNWWKKRAKSNGMKSSSNSA